VKQAFALFFLACATLAQAEVTQQVVDIPTRPGVTQRMVVLTPEAPKAAVVLFAGGHGGLQIYPGGSFRWGEGNFLVRTRGLFAEQGLTVAVVDAPSDRQSPPFLSGFRQTPQHAEDIKAVIAWLREQRKIPVWLIGTSRGTQSAAYVATQLAQAEGPDGLVLTSTILTDRRSRSVTEMPVERLHLPVLVVHHEQDGCQHCRFSDVPALMDKLKGASRTKLLAFTGGISQGDPCEARAHHGYNGQEREVVAQIAAWITKKN